MPDTTILVDHERRLTRAETWFEVNGPTILARLQKLEEAEDQREVDAEQARRREMADLRARAEKAEKALDAQKVNDAASTIAGRKS